MSRRSPQTYALAKRYMIGKHLDRELGSERAAVNKHWKASLVHSNINLKDTSSKVSTNKSDTSSALNVSGS